MKTRKKSRWFYFKKNLPLTMMALPGIILMILFKYLPLSGIVLAFKQYNIRDGIFGSAWNGLKHFEYLFRTKEDVYKRQVYTVLNHFFFHVFSLSCFQFTGGFPDSCCVSMLSLIHISKTGVESRCCLTESRMWEENTPLKPLIPVMISRVRGWDCSGSGRRTTGGNGMTAEMAF